jgi:hypothetical protein
MTNEQPKDRNDASTSSAFTSAEKRKEYNARYYASRKENKQPKEHNVVSNSCASTSTQKRKEYNARYYASRKESNKVSRAGTTDVSQSDPLRSLMSNRSTERIPLKTLQTNATQMPRENMASTQTPIDDSTPTTTLRSVLGEVMPQLSRGS